MALRPGMDHKSAPGPSATADTWSTGDKDAVGTAFERDSPVWFTAAHGALADVLYPQVDQDNVRQFGYLVTDGATFLFDETQDGVVSSRVTDHRALTYETTVSDPQHGFSLMHEFATDPARPVVLERTRLVGGSSRLHVYAYLVPHLRDSGLGQSAGFHGRLGWVTREGRWLVAGGCGNRIARSRISSPERRAGPAARLSPVEPVPERCRRSRHSDLGSACHRLVDRGPGVRVQPGLWPSRR